MSVLPFGLPVSGSAPNQIATKQGLDNGINASLDALQDFVEDTGALGWVIDLETPVGTNTLEATRKTPFEGLQIYLTGQKYIFQAPNTNTTAMTLDIIGGNEGGPYPLLGPGGQPLVAGDVVAGRYYMVRCGASSPESRNYRIISDAMTRAEMLGPLLATGTHGFVEGLQTSAGSNTIVATRRSDFVSLGIPDYITGHLYMLRIAEPNTGPVTVQIGDEPARPLLDADGNDLVGDELRADRYIMIRCGADVTRNYRIVTDMISERQRRQTIERTGVCHLTNVAGRNAITADVYPSASGADHNATGLHYSLTINQTNTSRSVTLKLNDEGSATPLPVYDIDGDRLKVGDLIAGRTVYLRRSGTFGVNQHYRVLTGTPVAAGAGGEGLPTPLAEIEVNIPTDFATMQAAYDANKFAWASILRIMIEDGHALTGGLRMDGDCIPDVRVSYAGTGAVAVHSSFSGASNTEVDPDLLSAVYRRADNLFILNDTHKFGLECLIDMNGEVGSGIAAQNSNFRVGLGCGVINAGVVGCLMQGGSAFALGSVWDGAGGEGIRVQQAANASFQGASANDCQSVSIVSELTSYSAVYVSRASDLQFQDGSCTGSGGHGLGCHRAWLSATDAVASGAALRGLELSHGGRAVVNRVDFSGAGEYGITLGEGATLLCANGADLSGAGIASLYVVGYGHVASIAGATTNTSPVAGVPVKADVICGVPGTFEFNFPNERGIVFADVDGPLENLRGGDDGQYLRKASDNDFDFEWAAGGGGGGGDVAWADILGMPDHVASFGDLTLSANVGVYATSEDDFGTYTLTSYGRTLAGLANEAALRANLSLVVGTNVQAYDADLAGIAALTSAANKLPYATGAQAWALTDFTAYGRTILALADEAALRANLGLTVGTNIQAYDADLAAIAALASAADKAPYATGAGTWALTDQTAFGRSLMAAVDKAAAQALLDIDDILTDLDAKADPFTGRVIASGDATLALTDNGKGIHFAGSEQTLTVPDGVTFPDWFRASVSGVETFIIAPAEGIEINGATTEITASPEPGSGEIQFLDGVWTWSDPRGVDLSDVVRLDDSISDLGAIVGKNARFAGGGALVAEDADDVPFDAASASDIANGTAGGYVDPVGMAAAQASANLGDLTAVDTLAFADRWNFHGIVSASQQFTGITGMLNGDEKTLFLTATGNATITFGDNFQVDKAITDGEIVMLDGEEAEILFSRRVVASGSRTNVRAWLYGTAATFAPELPSPFTALSPAIGAAGSTFTIPTDGITGNPTPTFSVTDWTHNGDSLGITTLSRVQSVKGELLATGFVATNSEGSTSPVTLRAHVGTRPLPPFLGSASAIKDSASGTANVTIDISGVAGLTAGDDVLMVKVEGTSSSINKTFSTGFTELDTHIPAASSSYPSVYRILVSQATVTSDMISGGIVSGISNVGSVMVVFARNVESWIFDADEFTRTASNTLPFHRITPPNECLAFHFAAGARSNDNLRDIATSSGGWSAFTAVPAFSAVSLNFGINFCWRQWSDTQTPAGSVVGDYAGGGSGPHGTTFVVAAQGPVA